MVAVKLYVEGGGNNSDLANKQCREGFRKFLLSAGLEGKMPRIVASGSRGAAYNDFRTAMRTRRPHELPLLLVDSEKAVADGVNAWQHLRACEGWETPIGATDEQVFLMVQCMEAWFLADHEALSSFFGQNFSKEAIPLWPNLEAVEKLKIFDALNKATARCKKRYAKGKVSFEILGLIQAASVEATSSHAARFLDYLRGLRTG